MLIQMLIVVLAAVIAMHVSARRVLAVASRSDPHSDDGRESNLQTLLQENVMLAGCEQQGPVEQVGQQIDQATRQAGEKAKEAGTAVGDKIEKAGEYLDDAAITAKIKGDIMSNPMLKVLEIGVITANGVVTLSSG